MPEYAGILVPPHAPGALSAALIDASGRSWDAARIAAHAGEFRWEDNVNRLDRILCDVAAASAIALGVST